MAEFTIPLHLASPTERSARAKDAQWLRAGHNVFEQDFHPGQVDGEFGPGTGAAVRQAKTLLGYPPKAVDESFGQQLYEFLTGKQPLPAPYAARRATLLKGLETIKTAKGTAVDAALADAAKHVQEKPVNLTPYGQWYGMNGVAWCCIYVSYQLVNAGFDGFERGKFASFCGNVVDAAKNRQRGLAITKEPERGDLVIYHENEHIEFFVEWVNPGE